MIELLGISVDVVKCHKKDFAQLEVHTMAQAVQWVNNQKKKGFLTILSYLINSYQTGKRISYASSCLALLIIQ